MRKINLFTKGVVVEIILLFGCGTFLPCLAGFKQQSTTQSILSNVKTNESPKEGIVTCYAFGKTRDNKQDVILSTDDATLIFNKLKELESEMTQHPFTEKTQSLKRAFVDLLDEKGLLPQGVSKESYLTLLNPAWVKGQQNSGSRASFLHLFANRGTCVLCSVGGEGSGILIPLFLLPRPRIAMLWLSSDSITTAANLLTGKGYVAGGAQKGFTFGFMGIGISYAVPGYTLYGFIGYALLASTTAEYVEHYPPNRAPGISDVNPVDNQQNVPLSLTELQFRIQDPDGNLMSYTVTTEPDIGSASGNLKPAGVYSVPVSGLKANSLYKWTVEVTDGKDTTIQNFAFSSIEVPFNPFDEGWQYRKQISINHSQVAGNLSNFPMLVHIIDADLRAKAQSDGDDILFMDGPGVAHKLYHEIENYQTSNGELFAWVNMMNLTADKDTVLYLYYGNPNSTSEQMSERVWNPYFAGVWHLKNFQDSTINGNHGTNYGTIASSGKIGDAREFDGSNDYILVDDVPSLNFHTANKFSISLWIKRDRLNTYESLISKATTAHMSGYAVQIMENNTIVFVLFDGSQEYLIYSNQIIVDTNWHYITVVWDGTQQDIFIDGVLDNSRNIGDVSIADDSKPLEFGHHYGYMDGKHPFDGSIDDIQISKIDRNSDWISTSHINQNNPSAFLSVGPEESHP
jgi:hypothetical protein